MTLHHVIGRLSDRGPGGDRTGRGGARLGASVVPGLWKAWWATTILLLAVGTVSRYDLVSSELLGPLVVGAEVAAADDPIMLVGGDAFDALPRVTYAGLDLALMNARAIPENNSGRPIIVVDLAVRNATPAQIRLPRQHLKLTSVDGATVALDRFEYAEHGSRLVVDSGETQQVLAVFKLRGRIGTDLDGYAIQIGEEGRWPESLLLDGQISPSAYPLPLEVLSTDDEPARYQDLVVELSDAATALEYGVYRSSIGQHLAVITISVSGAPGALDRGGLDRGLWTLADGQVLRRALKVTPGERSLDGNTVSIELVFAYGTEASELELFVGDASNQERDATAVDKEAVSVASFSVQAFE